MAAINEIVRDLILGQRLDEQSPDTKALMRLGETVRTAEGATYMYVTDSGAGLTGQGYAVAIDTSSGDPVVTLLTKTLADEGHPVGFVATNGAVTASRHLWICLEALPGAGPGIWTLASAAANVALYSSATAGALDDDSTSQKKINGVRLNTATGGSAALNATASIQAPRPVI